MSSIRLHATVGVLAAALVACVSSWNGKLENVQPLEREALEQCGSGAMTAEGGHTMMRAPVLQRVQQRRATVIWASWPEPGLGVEVSRPDGSLVAVAEASYAGDPKREERILAQRDDPEQLPRPRDYYVVSADVGGLDPDTLYCYRVVSARGALTEPAPVRTAPPPGDGATVRAAVLGDTGTGSAAQLAVAQRLSEHNFDFMLFLGDLAYNSGTPMQLQSRFFEVYREYLPYVPAFPAIGNHDDRTRDGKPFTTAFELPNNERWYSFDWGDVHFVALDTTSIGPAQARWLDRDLARNDRAWTVVYGHHPPITSALRGASAAYQRHFVPILIEHGVDLVLSGHEHHYERIGPVRGMHFIISGGGGGDLTYVGAGPATVARAAVHHFLLLEATAETLEVRAIDIEGREVDRLELTR